MDQGATDGQATFWRLKLLTCFHRTVLSILTLCLPQQAHLSGHVFSINKNILVYYQKRGFMTVACQVIPGIIREQGLKGCTKLCTNDRFEEFVCVLFFSFCHHVLCLNSVKCLKFGKKWAVPVSWYQHVPDITRHNCHKVSVKCSKVKISGGNSNSNCRIFY